MNGEIAQIVALTCYGNAFLSGQPRQPFFPANSTCQFCEWVTFVTLGKSILGKSRQTEVADSPDAWFSHLKARVLREGFGFRRRLRTIRTSPTGCLRDLSAAVEPGQWRYYFLRTKASSGLPAGKSVTRKRLTIRIWRVTYYGRVSRGKSNPSTVCELSTTIQELNESLKEVRAFSAKQELDVFTRCFDDALDTIETKGRNRHGYHQDLAPAGFLSEQAAILLDACQTVMGIWWNGVVERRGMYGEDQATYDRVSEHLFQAVNVAIEQAATSTMKVG